MSFSANRILLAVTATLCLAACSGSDEGSVSQASQLEEVPDAVPTSSVSIEEGDDGEISIESGDDSLTVTSNGSLPEGFPTAVPIPDGWTVDTSSNLSSGDQLAWSLYFELPGDAASATDDLKASMVAAGFSEVTSLVSDDGAVLGWESAEYFVQGVIAGYSDGGTADASLTVTSRTD